MECEYPIIQDNMLINGYRVLEKLKVSSKNSLYKVTQEISENEELKILKAFPYETEEEIECFRNESETSELLKNNALFITYDDQFILNIEVETKIGSRQISQYKKNYMFIVMKYYKYSDLERASENSRKGLNENSVVKFLFQSLNALKILHSKKIVHHDIKPSNFLIVNDEPLKFALIDFEFARRLPDDQKILSSSGTRTFLAPEILNSKEHDMAVDIWSLGMSAYKLAGGCYPYKILISDNENLIKNKIESNDLKFVGEYRKKSANLRNLLSKMLEKDPSQRITAEEALQNKLFENCKLIAEEEDEDEEDIESKLEPLGIRRN